MVVRMRRSKLGCINVQSGFAYLWVLLLVAFMGLGLALAAEVDATNVQREREKELISIGRQFRMAIGRYYETQLTAGRKEYPADLTDLLQDKRFPGVRRHSRQVFVDPMSGKKEWGLVRVGGRIVGVYSLSEKQPIKQDGFEADNASLKGKKKYSEWAFTYPADLVMQLEAAANKGQNTVGNQTGMPVSGSAGMNQRELGASTTPGYQGTGGR